MSDMMEVGMKWFAGMMQSKRSRSVTYRGIRNGSEIVASLTVGLGMSQLTSINMIGMQPNLGDMVLSDPIEVDRDYIVRVTDMQAVGLWPPDSGDFVDDINDEVGVTKRYQVKSVPSQAPFRFLRGGYNVLARVHAKFFQEIGTYWSDTFTRANGALIGHDPETGIGGYEDGLGTVSILSNRIVASTAPAYHYFGPGSLNTVTTVAFRINVSVAGLNGEVAELGVAVRCEPSGGGQREGVYCTVKVGYTGDVQSVRQLRMVRRRNGDNTTIATLTLPGELSLTTTYKLIVTNTEEKVLLTLADETGEVSIAEIGVDSTLLNDLTGQAVYFDHSLPISTGPWMDSLTVEAA